MFVFFILLCSLYIGPIVLVLAYGAIVRRIRLARAYRRHGLRSLVRGAQRQAIVRALYAGYEL